MKEYVVTAYPYATQTGMIKIPDDCKDVNEYVEAHWDEVKFEAPVLDYRGTDFELYEMDK